MLKKQLINISLNNLPKLTHFDASDNKIEKLTITRCPEITHLRIHDNSLTNLDFLNKLTGSKLTRLHLDNNNLSPQDVIIFQRFKNLTVLRLTNNPFYGSLQSLKNLDKLGSLAITNTRIDNDLEYLPDNLGDIAPVISQTLKKSPNDFKLTWTDIVKGNSSEYYPVLYYDFGHWKENQPLFKWLKDQLEKVDPGLDIHKVLENIFFNVKSGNFEGNLQGSMCLIEVNKMLFEEKEKRIRVLENEIKNLTYLVKQKKERIISNYLRFSQEKNLLQKMIYNHLKLIEAKKKKVSCDDLYKQAYENRKEMKKKLGKKNIEEIQLILTDCEELVNLEFKLKEAKLNDSKLLSLEDINIGNQKEPYNNLRYNFSFFFVEDLIKGLLEENLGKIEEISVFPTWFNGNCMMIVKKEKNEKYSLLTAVYEPAFGKTKVKLNLVEVMKEIPKAKEKWKEIIRHFENALDSDYPATELYNNAYIFGLPSLSQDYKNVVKTKAKILSEDNPNDFLKPYDIVKRKMAIPGHHVAIYLGNNQVAHISGEDKKKLWARKDNWKNFLKGETRIEIHHPFIPFKRPELIQKHIDIATEAKYGKDRYNLISNNCEHFATMCVYGLGICKQKNINTVNKITKNSDYLLKAIQESNHFFENLEKRQEYLEEWIEIPPKK